MNDNIHAQLDALKLSFLREHFEAYAEHAAREGQGHVDYLARLVDGEAAAREQRSIARRIQLARFPMVKTLDTFRWNWPTKINQLQVKNLFRLGFIEQRANVLLLGGVGLGKTHLAIALAHAACLHGHRVRFTTAVDAINVLAAAHAAGRLHQAMKTFVKPSVLVLDELGYLPIDKTGADLLFQIISQRYEKGSLIITSNRVYKDWAQIFNHDATLTSAILDRLLHHAETILIEGNSYRMKDRIDDP